MPKRTRRSSSTRLFHVYNRMDGLFSLLLSFQKLHPRRFLSLASHLFCVGCGRRRDQPQDIAFTSSSVQVQGWGSGSTTGQFAACSDTFSVALVVSCTLFCNFHDPAGPFGFRGGIRVPVYTNGASKLDSPLRSGKEIFFESTFAEAKCLRLWRISASCLDSLYLYKCGGL